MMFTDEKLSDRDIGERLRLARDVAKMTQAEASEVIGAARTTIVAIEKGQRRIRLNELQKLAAAYGTSANAILRREAVQLDLVPQFRKLSESEGEAVENASRLLNDLVTAEMELENALGIRRERRYPQERPILPGDNRSVVAQAEGDAQDLRDWLGIGPGPIADIVSVLDLQLNIRVYLCPLSSKISGLFAYDDRAGACMLLNAIHPRSRLITTAAHELGHFMSSRTEPEVLTENALIVSREERYANSFARGFLMPARVVRQRFQDITSGHSHLTRRHIVLLAYAFGVAREAMVRRLEELGLARKGTWDWFQANGGITDEQAQQVLGSLPPSHFGAELIGAQVPPRLALLAGEAWKRGIYSEGQLVRLLHLDRYSVRELLDSAAAEEGEEDDLVKIPR
ncbi:MAG: XRE family transcriptional regulator [Pseudomonadota bacterium]|nr:XRE family transcriptional regulator [Pseudomonadota bacterium]